MKENSEMLAQQAKSARIQVDSGPTIELVTPGAGKNGEISAVCSPNCIPNCQPSCIPSFPGPCAPDFRLPRPPGPPKPN